MRYRGKIFGIGLPKTGTTSLNEALCILGYRSCHYPHDRVTVEELRNAKYKLSILEQYDALTDVPAPAIYPQLDAAWPGSKFILTVRELESWLGSCRKAPFNQPEALPEPGSTRDFYRTLLYGCTAYSEERFAWVHQRHQKLVAEYFSGEKCSQLLVFDIIGGEGWEKLCPFLGSELPDRAFPQIDPHRPARQARRGNAKQKAFSRWLRRNGRKLLSDRRSFW